MSAGQIHRPNIDRLAFLSRDFDLRRSRYTNPPTLVTMRPIRTFSAVLAATSGIHAAHLALSERGAVAAGVDSDFLQGMDNAGLVETGW